MAFHSVGPAAGEAEAPPSEAVFTGVLDLGRLAAGFFPAQPPPSKKWAQPFP
jgi:hypothetical protein